MKRIRTVELFAGVGGFRLGLESASNRFQVVWANQWEPSMTEQYAFNCYVSHFGNTDNHICEDIAKVKNDVPDHDLLVGGFPCQDYSIMNKNSKGIVGTKGILWWQIDDILDKKRPKYVLLENVDRILWSPGKQCGRDFSIILRCLYEKGYAVEWRVINAADYGQAQRRRRTFIVAYHNDTSRFRILAEGVCTSGLKYMHRYLMNDSVLSKAFPISSHGQRYSDTWIDEMVFSDIKEMFDEQKAKFYNSGIMMNGRIYSVDLVPKLEKFISLKNILERELLDIHYFLEEKDMSQWRYAKGEKKELRRKRNGNEYLFTEGAVPFPDSLDRPSRTVITSESKIGRTSHVVCDLLTGKLRVLTPLECERLNGFPDNWTDTGMPEKMRYFMLDFIRCL